MPVRVSFPAPSSWTCPLCDGPLDQPDCPRCRTSFRSPDGQTLWRVDHDLHDLCRIRNDVATRLLLTGGGAPSDIPTASLDLASGVGADRGAVTSPPPPAATDAVGAVPGSAAGPGPFGPGLAGAGLTPEVGSGTGSRQGPAPSAGAVPAGWGRGPDRVGGPRPTPGEGPVPPGPAGPADLVGPAPRPAWSTAEVLVATGALSLVAAVAVFAAVAWDDLAGTAKAGLLLALTALTALVTGAARRRGLGATAEAVGLVSVALGVADVQVARVALEGSLAPTTTWSVGLALVAAAAVAGGRALGLRAVPAAGVALAFLPAVVLTAPGSAPAIAAALVGMAGVAVLVDRRAGLLATERAVLRTGGVLTWAGAGAVALGHGTALLLWDEVDGVGSVTGSVAVLLAAAAVAVSGVLAGRWSRSSQALVLGASVAPLLSAVLLGALAGPGKGEDVVAWVLGAAVLLVVAGSAVAAADRTRPWEAVTGVAAAVALALGVVPAVAVVLVASELLDTGVRAIEAGTTVGLDAAVASSARARWVDGAVVAQLVAVVVMGAVWVRRRDRIDAGGALAVGGLVGLAVVVPVVATLPIGVAVGGLLLAAVAAVGSGVVRRDAPTEVALGLGVGAVALLVALPSEALVLVATSVLVGLVAVGAVRVGDRAAPSAPSWAAGATTALVAGMVLVAVRLGVSEAGLVAVALVGAVVVAAVGPLLERLAATVPASTPWRRVAADVVLAVDAVGALAFGAALLLVRSVDQASVVLAAAGVAAGLTSLRPSRRTAWRAAVGAAVVVTWLQLGQAEVDLVEAYTLPLALAVLLVAGWGRRTRGSWDRLGAGLALAVGPTALLAVTTDDVVRTVVTVAVGALLAVWGAGARLQAPLAVGSAAVGVVAVRHLAPVAADLPRYLVLAVAGIVLLAVGATFEQRRSDLRHARDAFARLG